jgi:hypothetical protein
MGEHSLPDGFRVKCGEFFGFVRGGVCGECGRKIKVVDVEA